ncbi:UNVERIFIED_CONTAM: TetR/AcrR family transcriptional regulator [Clostridioides difficile]|uniref:TetR/AcrR family transcriptional regulator n=1 Tax=Clostridioides difficile TaxID=1496 RepID=UPI00038D68AA|nr:TetR/AcrR family transcriptional regulator [Clostridioides difficile]EQE85273.1 bacterial regulatory s, tetR family protein [Clostridioides difficile CD69]KJF62318.1 TetR family transcriptional regulator [Clostridioides difficile]MBY1133625.1 TetR/AcrR family transcriptional regulator [Clostridioides difficile]MBY1885684.1 TetR/AcrR family transcriptional regulator [Clostridioides difficile]MBZ0780010.1 TetR/AcrR family transcriptional regulator [Clostridioides difficile]
MNREEKSKNSKEKIIQSAFSLFSSKGYDSTSTQDIINLSGLSRGAMYHHFKTKEDILKSVTKELYSQMNNFLENLVADNTLTANEKIIKLIVHSANDYTHRKMVHCSWLEKIPFALIEEVRNLNNVVAPNIAKIIKQGVENKEFSCEYPQELAEMLVFSIDILLDPVLFKREYSEVCNRLDFLLFMLKKMDTPLIDECGIKKLKDLFKQ